VRECLTVNEAVDLLKKEKFGLLIAPFNGPDSAVVKLLREKDGSLPVIFFYDKTLSAPDASIFQGIHVLGSVDQATLVDGVSGLLADFLKKTGTADAPSVFCPIRTNLLIRVSPLKGDIYIRLSEEKFVKLFLTGDEFDQSDLQRYYETKGVEYMYLKRDETAEFIERFRRELNDLLAKPDLKQDEAIAMAEMSNEAIHELVQKVGFTEEVQELAKKNVELTLKSIGTSPRLSDLIGKVKGEGNYISQHSTLLAHVACCVAKEMAWGSDSTFSKLVLASFMHDIAVTNPDLAKLNTLKEVEERKAEFAEGEAKSYHLHPAKAADVVRSFKEIPADVDAIVQQHHERPNGSGFPRGLASNYIAPLSAVFIVAHELTQAILFQPSGFSMQDFVDEKKAIFNQGNFKKVMAALEKVKLE
jgi:hypothetical protein